VEEGIRKGLYLLQQDADATVQLIGSGVILREVIKAAKLLKEEYGVHANVWSATSFNELARDGMAVDYHNRLHPQDPVQVSWVAEQLAPHKGVVLAATDHIRAYSEQIRSYLPDHRPYVTLGTDGFGRSDTRENLRAFFGVDAANIVVAVLKLLADEDEIDVRMVKDAISSFEIETNLPPSWMPQPHFEENHDAPAPAVPAQAAPLEGIEADIEDEAPIKPKPEDVADAPAFALESTLPTAKQEV